ncbi:MAG: hypothetical protein A2498_12370 [Lentisphaerae bacterium RIFOXYC12_FULL_60_16]|nr:MAG: hypothetical protein A2498_12370 [Lentisphaerae bacterium RIFOXYC12_FULL_60_16]OGV73777.1 MAG: hypothetical protein A2269_05495 [Lentisphaerae bacterium RIFOXYA12_FULL_60_10]
MKTYRKYHESKDAIKRSALNQLNSLNRIAVYGMLLRDWSDRAARMDGGRMTETGRMMDA